MKFVFNKIRCAVFTKSIIFYFKEATMFRWTD